MTPIPPKVAQLLMALGRLPPDEARALLIQATAALDAVERRALMPHLPSGLALEVQPPTIEDQTVPWPMEDVIASAAPLPPKPHVDDAVLVPPRATPSTGEVMARAFPRPSAWRGRLWLPVAGVVVGLGASFVLWGPWNQGEALPLPVAKVSALEELAPLAPMEPPPVVQVKKRAAPSPARVVSTPKRTPVGSADPFETRK